MTQAKGYAAFAAESPLAPITFERREVGAHDVQIEILFCGVCHSDLHAARNDWGSTTYPVVPGHEIVGRVKAVGAHVTSVKPGDAVAVGCLVGSCRKCDHCDDGLEQYCFKGIGTYGSPEAETGGRTNGGYSDHIVVNDHFVLRMPDGLDLAAAAPLLCAGITSWSPLQHWKVGKGSRVGIVGLGGLGHMGVKFAHAMGAHVVVFTTSPSKVADAKKLGADEVVLSTSKEEMSKLRNSLDFILDTVAAGHDLNPYVKTLKRDGTICLVGVPPVAHASDTSKSPPISMFSLMNRRSVAGSVIGGIKETQEMLDFCGKHNIVCDIEMIRMQDIEKGYERILKNDVKYRFVIDMATL